MNGDDIAIGVVLALFMILFVCMVDSAFKIEQAVENIENSVVRIEQVLTEE